ncbi:MAG: FAD-binding oxidoreductase [Alphaproteobacteria bacterium]
MDLSKLEKIFGERLATSEAIRLQHSHDESWHVPESIPDAVVFPESTDEVSTILNFANERKIPVIPFGAGTSLEGQVHALKGGITINSLNMNKIKEVNLEDMDCKVQPGVTREDLNLFLRDTGLFFSNRSRG